MKIKVSFITNSSSTTYVVFIPDVFSVKRDYVRKIFEDEINQLEDNETGTKQNILKNIEDIVDELIDQIEELKQGDQYCYYDYIAIEAAEWNSIIKICEENNFVLTSADGPVGSNDCIIGITQEAVLRILTSYIDLDEFLKPFIKGV